MSRPATLPDFSATECHGFSATVTSSERADLYAISDGFPPGPWHSSAAYVTPSREPVQLVVDAIDALAKARPDEVRALLTAVGRLIERTEDPALRRTGIYIDVTVIETLGRRPL